MPAHPHALESSSFRDWLVNVVVRTTYAHDGDEAELERVAEQLGVRTSVLRDAIARRRRIKEHFGAAVTSAEAMPKLKIALARAFVVRWQDWAARVGSPEAGYTAIRGLLHDYLLQASEPDIEKAWIIGPAAAQKDWQWVTLRLSRGMFIALWNRALRLNVYPTQIARALMYEAVTGKRSLRRPLGRRATFDDPARYHANVDPVASVGRKVPRRP